MTGPDTQRIRVYIPAGQIDGRVDPNELAAEIIEKVRAGELIQLSKNGFYVFNARRIYNFRLLGELSKGYEIHTKGWVLPRSGVTLRF